MSGDYAGSPEAGKSIHSLPTAGESLSDITLSQYVGYLKNAEDKLLDRERKLNDALTEAHRASRAKSVFLSNMSHDLRTPLNSIINLATLAKDDIGDRERLIADLENISSAGEYMLGLINDILDMSKIESGKIELHPAYYSFSDFAECIYSVILPLCKAKGVNFDFETSPAVSVPVKADKTRVNQIFFNLLSNAVKFTPPGGTVRFFEKNISVINGFLVSEFCISDNGCGMSEEFKSRLFTPFERENTDDAYSGTGLGLVIAKHLAELMGGGIGIESKKGVGTDVFVTLRLPCAEKSELCSKESASVPASVRGNRRVLVVEDNEMNRFIAVRILEKHGYLVDCACDGKEAVEIIADSDGCYMAVLMDVRMPVMDGLSATRAIRALGCDYAKELPIIAMTANACDGDMRDCLDSGMNAFLSKPVMPEKLYETLALYL